MIQHGRFYLLRLRNTESTMIAGRTTPCLSVMALLVWSHIRNSKVHNIKLYSIAGNRIERCLSYDEKPLLLFQRLKDAKKNPVFMLKHIKDIRSPIAVAQQKHAARKASSVDGHSSSPANGKSSAGSGSGHSRSTSRPPKLEVSDMSQPIMTGVTPQPGWPEIISPTAEQKEQDLGSAGNASIGGMNGSSEKARSAGGSGDSGEHGAGPVIREIPVPIAGVSYAVAIYPYMAEQDDEFDVVV
jgi:protein STE50